MTDARRSRLRRLRAGFFTEASARVEELVDILGSDPEGAVRESVFDTLGRLADSAEAVELPNVGGSARRAAAALLEPVTDARVLRPVLRDLRRAGMISHIHPIAIVGDAKLQRRLRPDIALCSEPVYLFDDVASYEQHVCPLGFHALLAPGGEVDALLTLGDEVPRFVYGPPTDLSIPLAATRHGLAGFLLEPLDFSTVLDVARAHTWRAESPRPRIAILHSDQHLRTSLEIHLSAGGAHVSASGAADALLLLLSESCPDVVVLGQDTDGVPASALTRVVHSWQRHHHPRVLIVGSDADGSELLQAGAEAVLNQDLAPDRLAELIQERLQAPVHRGAIRDHVTGLLARPAVLAALDRELARARRTGRPLSAALVDVDDTRSFNDRFGRNLGNTVLRTVGRILSESLRVHDVVGRLDSDTFLVALTSCRADQARERLRQVRKALSRVGSRDERLQGLSFSVGIADTDTGLASVLLRANQALARARTRGGPGVLEVA